MYMFIHGEFEGVVISPGLGDLPSRNRWRGVYDSLCDFRAGSLAVISYTDENVTYRRLKRANKLSERWRPRRDET